MLGHRGGPVDAGYELTIRTQAGSIYYTLDGSDPRLAGGGISPSAIVIPAGTVERLPINHSLVVRARSRSGSTWSALAEAEFFVNAASATNLAITELYYHPQDPTPAELAIDPTIQNDDFEFIELKNVGSHAVDLVGVQFVEGITFDFTESDVTSLGPGEFVLLVKNVGAFDVRFGAGLPVAGVYDGQLSNGGERLVLQDRFANVMRIGGPPFPRRGLRAASRNSPATSTAMAASNRPISISSSCIGARRRFPLRMAGFTTCRPARSIKRSSTRCC
jgi:hypothetical protein